MEAHKLLFLSCIGEAVDTHTVKYIKTLLEHNFNVVSIRTGPKPPLKIKHYQLPDITSNFWPSGISVFAFFLAVFQRFRNFWMAFFILFKVKPTVICATEPDAWLLACIAKLFFRNKVVADIREVYEDRIIGFPSILKRPSLALLKFTMKGLSGFTDEIIHVSKERQDVYSYLKKKGKIIVYYPDLQEKLIKDHEKCHQNFQVIHAGSLRDKYGASEILSAFEIISKSDIPVKLIVLGGTAGPIKATNKIPFLIRKGVLEILPQMDFEKVLMYMEGGSLGLNIVLPVDQSHYLAQPRKLYEYLSKGLPFVASDVPTIRKVYEKWHCGKLVKSNDSAAIAKAIMEAYTDKEWLMKASCRAFTAHQQEYNWHLENQKLVHIFSELK